jgi:lipopolysaccharide/colanic/teichoic acid biosynthesis glycosyltransferase
MPWWKRATDIGLVLLALVVLGPLMLLAALLIKLSSSGPVFYVAPRMGRGGVPFGQLKFRTMHVGADRQGAFTAQHDRRVFPVGRWLRLFKIDELPQILNVLRGEMSVVGPRPEEIGTVERCYTAEQRRVLDVLPGLTGLPQVRYFPELSVIDPGGMDPQEHYQKVILPVRLEMDLEYIRRQSFWFDAGLIIWTVYLIVVRAPLMAIGLKPRRVELPQLAGGGSRA